MNWDLEVDAVVAGAGACGLVAASRLAETGLDVVVIEKMDVLGGNTALSQGMIPAAGTSFQIDAGVQDSPEDLFQDIMNKNGNSSDPGVTRAVSENAWLAVEWLAETCQVELTLCTDFNYPGFSQMRMHAPPSRSGRDLLHSLERHVSQQPNITLAMRAPLTAIIPDDLDPSQVNGVEIIQSGETVRIKSRVVMLACNGFGANKDMVQSMIPEMLEALYFGHGGNTGDALLLAKDIGASWASMSGFQGHASVAVPHGILITWGTVMTGGILLNTKGQRFTNELKGYSEMSLEVMAQPDSVAFELFDQNSYDAAASISDFRLAIEAGAVRRFESSSAFEEGFHLPTGSVSETLGKYNAQVDTFGRSETRSLEAPFYGIRIGPALFHTQGGLKINPVGQVIKSDGVVFQNLYAGGGSAEGLSGSHPKGYLSGNGLLSAVVLGYIAGGHAAQKFL